MKRRSGARIRKPRLFAGILALAVPVSAFYWLYDAGLKKSVSTHSLSEGNTIELELPFTVPCAVSSEDATTVYVALQHRDRRALAQLFAEKRMISMQRGLPVRLSLFGNVAMLAGKSGSSDAEVCFVPSDIVAVIRQHSRS
jgi:hypothetical protein